MMELRPDNCNRLGKLTIIWATSANPIKKILQNLTDRFWNHSKNRSLRISKKSKKLQAWSFCSVWSLRRKSGIGRKWSGPGCTPEWRTIRNLWIWTTKNPIWSRPTKKDILRFRKGQKIFFFLIPQKFSKSIKF